VFSSKGALTIDKKFYIESQIMSTVTRLISVLDDLPASRIAEIFHLNPQSYIQREQHV
jgi:hypothetical protein